MPFWDWILNPLRAIGVAPTHQRQAVAPREDPLLHPDETAVILRAFGVGTDDSAGFDPSMGMRLSELDDMLRQSDQVADADWREHLEGFLDLVIGQLQALGISATMHLDDDGVEGRFKVGRKSAAVKYAPAEDDDFNLVMGGVNHCISGKAEYRVLRSSEGSDGWVFALLSDIDWRVLDADAPRATALLFLRIAPADPPQAEVRSERKFRAGSPCQRRVDRLLSHRREADAIARTQHEISGISRELTALLSKQVPQDKVWMHDNEVLISGELRLELLGVHHGAYAIAEMAAGDPLGVHRVHLAAEFHHWSLKYLLCRYRRHGSSLTLDSGRTASLYCHAAAYDLHDWIENHRALLQYMSRARGAYQEGVWPSRCFERFVLEFHRMRSGEEFSCEDLGPYSAVFTNWLGEGLANALLGVCDYHCDHIEPTRRVELPEFERCPTDLIPWEVVAIYRTRARLGLQTPLIEHPLMRFATPFLTDAGPIVGREPLLQHVASFYGQHYS